MEYIIGVDVSQSGTDMTTEVLYCDNQIVAYRVRPPSQELDEWEPELMMEVGNDWQEGVDEVTD